MASKYDIYIDDVKHDYYINKMSMVDICKKYDIKSHTFLPSILEKRRTHSEYSSLVRQQYPDKFHHSEETKNKIREKRLKYMREHPEDTAWRKKNKPSYPEQLFINFLQEKGYDEKFYIEREFPVFPFYIDFAFVDEKIAVEIDGSQHLEVERELKDKEKDNLLIKNGWHVIRFSETIVKNDWGMLEKTLNECFSGKVYSKVGILKHQSQKFLEKRNKFGRTEKQEQMSINNRKVRNRPTKEELLNLIQKYHNFCKIARLFNVSDNTIRKWCKWYRLPRRIKDYNIG